jgi:hypothetical protein
MNDIAPGIGHNAPPLADILTEETKPLRERADALITSVNNSHIDSPESAAAVATLGNIIRGHREAVEAARKAAAQPYDDGKALVQATYARGILDPLDAAMAACRKMLDAWRMQLAAEAAAERRKRDAEAAEARRVAEEAESKKIELEAAGDTSGALAAELRQLQAEEHAEKLTAGEGAIRPEAAIRTQAGMAGTATTVTGKIENIGSFLAWLIRNDPKWLSEILQPRADRLMRSGLSVDGVARVETSSTRFRR